MGFYNNSAVITNDRNKSNVATKALEYYKYILSKYLAHENSYRGLRIDIVGNVYFPWNYMDGESVESTGMRELQRKHEIFYLGHFRRRRNFCSLTNETAQEYENIYNEILTTLNNPEIDIWKDIRISITLDPRYRGSDSNAPADASYRNGCFYLNGMVAIHEPVDIFKEPLTDWLV